MEYNNLDLMTSSKSTQVIYMRPNYARIDIMWENYGYKNYRDTGLYGSMNTKWQEVEMTGNNTFIIYGDNYESI